jgi:hypothetical protein
VLHPLLGADREDGEDAVGRSLTGTEERRVVGDSQI